MREGAPMSGVRGVFPEWKRLIKENTRASSSSSNKCWSKQQREDSNFGGLARLSGLATILFSLSAPSHSTGALVFFLFRPSTDQVKSDEEWGGGEEKKMWSDEYMALLSTRPHLNSNTHKIQVNQERTPAPNQHSRLASWLDKVELRLD